MAKAIKSIFRRSYIWFFILLSFNNLQAQDSTQNTINKKRLTGVIVTGATLYTGSMIALNEVWYKNQGRSSFHFFNDNNEWLQMDKVGHGFSAYYQGFYGYRFLKWSGVPEKKAVLYGGTWGIIMQTPIEVLDGFSKAWGASSGDIIANTLGTGLFVGQQLAWHEQKVQLKFSFTPTKYAPIKPNLLGSSLPEQLIKDYNGQTYWLSTNLNHILPSKKIPQWLNLAAGYGADGMLRGTFEDQHNDISVSNYSRSRQYYLSLDVDFLKVKTKKKWVSNICTAIAFIKVPSPTLEFHEKQGFKFHFIYF